jgi:hypothetical protein
MQKWVYYSFNGDNPGSPHVEFEEGSSQTSNEYLETLEKDSWELIAAIKINREDLTSNSHKFFLRRPLED